MICLTVRPLPFKHCFVKCFSKPAQDGGLLDKTNTTGQFTFKNESVEHERCHFKQRNKARVAD